MRSLTWAQDERVDACYAAALENGGKGLSAPNRESRHIYICKFKDPDGNTVQVMHWTDDQEKPTGQRNPFEVVNFPDFE